MTINISTLERDLVTYANEKYTKEDIASGVNLINEKVQNAIDVGIITTGVAVVGTMAFQGLVGAIPIAGRFLSSQIGSNLARYGARQAYCRTKPIQKLYQAYSELDPKDRKLIRIAIRAGATPFAGSLEPVLKGADYINKAAGIVGTLQKNNTSQDSESSIEADSQEIDNETAKKQEIAEQGKTGSWIDGKFIEVKKSNSNPVSYSSYTSTYSSSSTSNSSIFEDFFERLWIGFKAMSLPSIIGLFYAIGFPIAIAILSIPLIVIFPETYESTWIDSLYGNIYLYGALVTFCIATAVYQCRLLYEDTPMSTDLENPGWGICFSIINALAVLGTFWAYTATSSWIALITYPLGLLVFFTLVIKTY